jgi:glycyl-tRNA synthetase
LINFFDSGITEEDKQKIFSEIEENNFSDFDLNSFTYKLTAEMVSFKKVKKTLTEEKFLPGVIEPSFGIGRIIWSILEHRFQKRVNDEKRTYFNFPPKIAPVKCSILPLISTKEF